MHALDQRVHSGVCEICALRHEPPPETFRPFPPPLSSPAAEARPRGQCRYLGPETGLRDCPTCLGNVRIKVFACTHSAHVETTNQECLVCPDHGEGEERGQVTGDREEVSR